MQQPKVISLKNTNGIIVQLSTYGATLLSLEVPDRNGVPTNVVVGLDKPETYPKDSYIKHELYLGSTIGRYAGRIAKGAFEIDGQHYPISHQNGVHLHGGKAGFDKKYWTVEHVNTAKDPSVTFSYLSTDMEEGYPGNLEARVTYTLTETNALRIVHEAVTDKTTYVNLTNHAYFNLEGNGSVTAHELYVNATHYLEVKDNLIPTGTLIPVVGSRFDFTSVEKIGSADFTGFDDTFVLNGSDTTNLKASLYSALTGITMEVYTDQPAIVIYTPPVFPDLPFKKNAVYTKFPAICFETQHFPDAPHQPHFPSTLLKPGSVYRNESTFQFSCA